jgi:hypothetical protein
MEEGVQALKDVSSLMMHTSLIVDQERKGEADSIEG